MIDNKNMILAVILSVLILIAFETYTSWRHPKPIEAQRTTQQAAPAKPQPGAPPATQAPAAPTDAALAPTPPGAPAAPDARPGGLSRFDRAALLKASPRVRIASSRVHGSISLIGGRLDDLTLIQYRETPEATSPEIIVLQPRGAPDAYFAEFGWVAGQGEAVPGPDTRWTADGAELTPRNPVRLTWDNGQGLRFARTFALDDNFMFTVTDEVENKGAGAAAVTPYGLISRSGTPKTLGYYILHEGPFGVFDGTLKELNYDDLKEKKTIEVPSSGGWIGITDKYWMAALVPDQKAKVNARFLHRAVGTTDRYQVDWLGETVNLAPGAMASNASRLFTGAKEVQLLDSYAESLGVARFDLAIDFGWFYFLTKPIFLALIFLHKWVGNFGVAILLLTVAIKLVFFPLANKSYVAMSKMKKLQPDMLKLRERFGDDRARLNQEMMALYKREKANPASGCLPIVIQIPVFFALYKVLFVTIEMRHAPFFGWIHDLSAHDPTTVFNLFGLIPWTPPDFLMIGVWPLIMGVTMFLQQKLNPQPTDPIQAKVFMFLPLIFTVLLAQFPAGLVIYWAWNNLLSIIQQKVIMHRMGVS